MWTRASVAQHEGPACRQGGRSRRREGAASIEHVEQLLRSGLVLEVDAIGRLLANADPSLGDDQSVDRALEGTLSFLDDAAGEQRAALSQEVDQVLQVRASRLVDMRSPAWALDLRTASTALAVGYVLGWAALDGEPAPPDAGEPRWWYLVAGATRLQDLGCVAAHTVLAEAADRVNRRLFDGSDLARRALLDGMGVAIAQALTATGAARAA